MANHGVSSPLWDLVFGTAERPTWCGCPRRLALPWLLDADGELRPSSPTDYVLVGAAEHRRAPAPLDRARAFASVAPADYELHLRHRRPGGVGARGQPAMSAQRMGLSNTAG